MIARQIVHKSHILQWQTGCSTTTRPRTMKQTKKYTPNICTPILYRFFSMALIIILFIFSYTNNNNDIRDYVERESTTETMVYKEHCLRQEAAIKVSIWHD